MEKWLALVGRILFSLIFIMSGIGHLTDPAPMVQYTEAMGVPAAKLMVILTGLMILLGGISILLGFKARLGALLIILFLIPVTPIMHRFFTIDDPQQRMIQMIMFMKNLSMLGGAFIIAAFGPGEISIDKK